MGSARSSAVGFVACTLALALAAGPSGPIQALAESPIGATPDVVNVIGESGIRRHDFTYGASPVDVDRDGDQDVLVSNHLHPSKLWRNNGRGRFTRIAHDAWPRFNSEGKAIDRHACAWADVDRNGRPDAFCATGRTDSNFVKFGRDNELWLQRRDGTFREVGTSWRIGDVCGRGRRGVFLDANGDRYPDLFLANFPPRQVPDDCNRLADRLPNERSKLYINQSGERFRYTPARLRVNAGVGGPCALRLDFNRDGWDDLFTCRNGGTPRLFRNRHGRFALVNNPHLDYRVRDAALGDMDGDRDIDLVTASARQFSLHLFDSGSFGPRARIGLVPEGGNGHKVSTGDIDGDGDLDVYGMVDDFPRSNPVDFIWFNQEMVFDRLRLPRTGGFADDVEVLHPWRNDRAGFLVMNGWAEPGPISLVRVTG